MENNVIQCMDVAELCPPYDNGATASVAAKLIAKVIAMNLSSK
jgi:agmatinase